MMGELVRALIELAIRQLRLTEDHGDGVGRPLSLFLEQLRNGPVPWIAGLRIVPFNQQVMAFSLGQQRQCADSLRRIGDDSFQ